MTTLKTWGGAGLATGTLTTTSAGTGDTPFNAVSGTLNITADGIRSPCIGVPDGTGVANATWNVTPTSWALRCYVKAGTNAGIFFTAYTASSAKAAQLDFNASAKLRLTGVVSAASSVLWTSSVAPTTATWYRVEVTYNGTTGAWAVAYYPGDSTTATQTGSGTQDTGLTLATVSAGRNGGTTTGLVLDDLAVADTATMLGPATTAPAATQTHYLYNGTAWVPSTKSLIG